MIKSVVMPTVRLVRCLAQMMAAPLGALLGSDDGCALGALLGSDDGCALGALLGSDDGCALGALLGSDAGCRDCLRNMNQHAVLY